MPEPSQKDIEALEQSRRAAVRNYRIIKSDVARTPPPERRGDKFTKIFRQLDRAGRDKPGDDLSVKRAELFRGLTRDLLPFATEFRAPENIIAVLNRIAESLSTKIGVVSRDDLNQVKFWAKKFEGHCTNISGQAQAK